MEIDELITFCISSKLTPNKYCILSLLFNKQYEKIREFSTSTSTSTSSIFIEMKELEDEGYIKITEENNNPNFFEKIGIRERTFGLFNKEKDRKYLEYLEIWTMFPFKVPDGVGGYRPLRAKSYNSDDFKRGFKLWTEIIRKESPKDIKLGLEKQLVSQRNKLQYTQNFLTWLRQKTWQQYISIDTDKTETETIKVDVV